ncbi:RINT-1 family protein [Pyrenophora tritici-repentis]|uniref:RINT-1 / TIP-1 protein n=1 Tax=Pyrenophora tritici-repentis TaxID=45151 RepID=A0A2W1FFV7_9PLEO|nr:RINT-1 family protein [Pyrenophora tritici-repentis]KAG9380381.1 rint-1 family protein [Pyrenophora tritici-repentis]KAI0584688.1 rint-1 family protein [Pyrenophora tritici-repentis]KAI0625207.1 rint-1 family protein [Pyrenophora tritici-repentis]KAI1512546.1 RINT-1 / TIP-1 protein [Pyrenophora tritici-repentis]
MDDQQARVADYLDDKLQTQRDLDSLDDLLATITAQHGVLKQQLDDAQRDLHDAKHASHKHHADRTQQADRFWQDQTDIDRRLLVLTASDTSDKAVENFQEVLDTLQRLDVANEYVELLAQVDALDKQAHAQLQTSNEAALEPYKQLRALHTRLLNLQDDAEGAGIHLLNHIGNITQALRTTILDAFSADLDRTLKKIHWPTPKATIPDHLREEWETAVIKLLDLQLPELDGMSYASRPGDKVTLPPVLFPVQILVQPLEMRFRYHFDGDKPTNRIDRPEYFLSHITTLLNDYSAFVTDHVQPILFRHFRGTHLALNPVYIDAMSAFITALLPMLRAKISSLLPKVAGQPQLLSHLMHELMSFDLTIKDTWGYDGGYGVDGWKGLSWEFLVQGDWFGRWLQVEKDFALSRYQNIVEAPDFGDLDYDSVDPKATKPTKGAIRVNDLLETITDRYRPLASFSQKLTFLIDIQIAIFDKLHERLQSNLEAYLSLTTSLGRAMGGVTKGEQEKLLGVQGLERLCKTYGSADYLERAMRDWSDDVFFLDIWEGLQDRARGKTSNIGTMSVADVAERTSRNVENDDGGSLFDETASWYARLRDRSEGIIIDTLNSNVREALRPYRNINPWATLSGPSASASNATDLSPTAEIDPLLTYLRTTLSFLSRALATAPLRRITRAVLTTISTVIWDNVLTSNRYRFSTQGAAQLSVDLGAVCRVVNEHVGPFVAEAGLRKCLEGVKLVGLPVKGSPGSQSAVGRNEKSTHDASGDDEEWDTEAWGAEDGDDEAPRDDGPQKASANREQTSSEGDDGIELGLWEVERRVFADNQSARDVLDELGLELLDEKEARALMMLRVELAG